MPAVLIVDDEPNIRRMVAALLSAEGYDVRDAADGAAGLALAESTDADVALVDLMMPGPLDGLALLERLRERRPDLPVIMMSGRAGLADAVRATKLGAFTFLEKPLTPEGVLLALASALELRQARRATATLRAELGLSSEMIGDAPALREVRSLIARVGPTDARVLITGESGTGKELVAAALHHASPRRDRPFVRVNCAAIPRDLVESEMFGHERGAFTGATERRIGRFELAHTGTLLLDEVGDLGSEAQAKLLRAIEAREIERVGGGKPIRVDVRILAATNKDLPRAVAEGTFREDLFFRLNVIPVHLPPLRDRPGDLGPLVRHFAERHRARTGSPLVTWSETALAALAAYPWPGNVRELANVVERLAILHAGEPLDDAASAEVLPAAVRRPRDAQSSLPATPGAETRTSADPVGGWAALRDLPLTEALDRVERQLIADALAQGEGNVTEAARRLQTDRPNLYRRMRRLGLSAIAALLLAGMGAPLPAQPLPTRAIGAVPRDVALEAARVFNAATTRRVRGDLQLTERDTVRGDLAVLNGQLDLAGVVLGEVVVLNGDVRLAPTGRVARHLTVIGGALASPERPGVDGDIRVWQARFRYAETADSLVAQVELAGPWLKWTRETDRPDGGQLFVTTAHTYNRVEGLPFLVGPRVRLRSGDLRVSAEALGILRTGDGLAWRRENLGHQARVEVRQGQRRGVAFGARVFDVVDAVEAWQLSDAEVGLASFAFKRDYRDYWQRHGGAASLSLFGPAGLDVRAEWGVERWGSRRARDAFTLFGNGIAWRPNPAMDAGRVRLATVRATLDTRLPATNPRAGWYLRAELEQGSGPLDSLAPTTPGIRSSVARGTPGTPDGDLRYLRLFVDARRYTRMGPYQQLNARVVFGGGIAGDPLPLQRRFAVSGIDALPGYDFRQLVGTGDIGTCATGTADAYWRLGRPAQCERMLLVQLEWKGDFRLRFSEDADRIGARRWSLSRVHADGTWMLFGNSGRGWLVGSPIARQAAVQAGAAAATPSDDLWYPSVRIPLPRTWRTDIGGGLDFGTLGVFVAKAVSDWSQPANVYVRLGRRF